MNLEFSVLLHARVMEWGSRSITPEPSKASTGASDRSDWCLVSGLIGSDVKVLGLLKCKSRSARIAATTKKFSET